MLNWIPYSQEVRDKTTKLLEHEIWENMYSHQQDAAWKRIRVGHEYMPEHPRVGWMVDDSTAIVSVVLLCVDCFPSLILETN